MFVVRLARIGGWRGGWRERGGKEGLLGHFCDVLRGCSLDVVLLSGEGEGNWYVRYRILDF